MNVNFLELSSSLPAQDDQKNHDREGKHFGKLETQKTGEEAAST